MSDLIYVGLAGFGAALVDGALGMGFGPTSSSLLLSIGVPPASVSTTVNLAKTASGVAGAVSHWRFRNIDHKLVLQLAIPGAVGAMIGVTVLSNVDGDSLRPVLAVLLLVIGLRMLWRFSRPLRLEPEEFSDIDGDPDQMPAFDSRGVKAVAAAGGITNGMIGAWGPVVTPFLMQRGLAPRFAVGSVNTAEVVVATVSAASLMAALGSGGLDIGIVLAMLAGGVVAAPVAAFAVRHVPARPMGVAVAALLLFTNSRELSGTLDLGESRWLVYGWIIVAVTAAGLGPRLREASRLAATRRAPGPPLPGAPGAP